MEGEVKISKKEGMGMNVQNTRRDEENKEALILSKPRVRKVLKGSRKRGALKDEDLTGLMDENNEFIVPRDESSLSHNPLVIELSEKFISPSNDVLFKYIFSNPKRKHILLALINSILEPHFKIVSLTILNPGIPPESQGDSTYVLDILCVTEEGDKIDIEMESGSYPSAVDKDVCYLCRMHGEQDAYRKRKKKQNHYDTISYSISISIFSQYSLFENTDIVTRYVFSDPKTHHILTEKVQFFTLECQKLQK